MYTFNVLVFTGRVDKTVIDALLKTATQKIEKDGILATRLCSHTKDADVINETKLKELPGKSRVFEAQDSVPGVSKQFEQQTAVPTKLELKVGAQVTEFFLQNVRKWEFFNCNDSFIDDESLYDSLFVIKNW